MICSTRQNWKKKDAEIIASGRKLVPKKCINQKVQSGTALAELDKILIHCNRSLCTHTRINKHETNTHIPAKNWAIVIKLAAMATISL
jgi:hypothetical protein